jgi:hypothetical protein
MLRCGIRQVNLAGARASTPSGEMDVGDFFLPAIFHSFPPREQGRGVRSGGVR